MLYIFLLDTFKRVLRDIYFEHIFLLPWSEPGCLAKPLRVLVNIYRSSNRRSAPSFLLFLSLATLEKLDALLIALTEYLCLSAPDQYL